jgi:hypothetical protein
MKKIILSFAVLLLSSSAFALIPGFSFGPKAALGFSKLSTNLDEMRSSMKPGFDLGIFARVGNKLYLQPEVTYSFKNGKLKDIWNEAKNLHSSALDVPVLVGYKLADIGAANIRAFAGPKFSFVLDDNWHAKTSNFNFGGQAGLGLDLLMLTVDFRYDHTFSNMSKMSGQTIRSNGFLISLGWKLL